MPNEYAGISREYLSNSWGIPKEYPSNTQVIPEYPRNA